MRKILWLLLLLPAFCLAANKTTHQETIVLGSGCFWGAEKSYEAINGVLHATSGYADGQGVEPNYKSITARKNRFNPNNFAEVVKVTYNPEVISAKQLIQHFFEHHDPTQLNRQGNDVGTQYRSIILYSNEAQKQTAWKLKAQYQTLLSNAGFGKIVTVIKPLQAFYPAEDYHQDYLAKNPDGYCPDHSTGVVFNAPEKAPEIDNKALLTGKHIVVLEAKGYCPYCEKFKAKVSEHYRGTIPMHKRVASQLQGLTLQTPTFATPTIYFLEDGKEQFAKQGYMSPEEFYKALGYFKLGDSEAFNVAFNKGTDNRFCKQYDKFKNTGPGVFIDKLSGAPLFDTRYRFNSGTGWLSFTQPIAGSVLERPDNSYGMQRTEVLAKVSGVHLGHVFNDGPNGQPRYCINATVLEFQPLK